MKALLGILFLFTQTILFAQQNKLPQGFDYADGYLKNSIIDLRYYGDKNFVGASIDGYQSNKLILTKKAILAVQKVEKELNEQGLGLKIFDGYRPQSAVDHFKRWAKDIKDTKTRTEYYPKIDKRNLFRDGFIASKSGHSRGSTIDLTIIDLKTKKELVMGTPFDFFGDESGHNFSKLPQDQIKNRKILKSIMEKHGFKAYDKEWWHYTLKDEPYQKTYFNFPVK